VGRDKQKEVVSKEEGISLVIIPFWWQHSKDFLLAKIAEKRPDIAPEYATLKTPTIPLRNARGRQDKYIPSQSREFDERRQDPSGW
jgi:hypothetical protein